MGAADVNRETRPIRLVLDTNVVLDWLVFDDASVRSLRQGIEEQWISVITHTPAVDELQRVLAYPQFELDTSRQAELLTAYRRHACFPPLPEGFSRGNLMLPTGFPHCRDPDDQPFLALAHHAHADALVSKDRAVLKLRRRAGKYGVKILSVRDLGELSSLRQALRS